MLLRMGRVAGKAVVRVSAAAIGVTDSAVFETKPGNAVRVHPAGASVSVSIGSTASLRSSIVDRYGNAAGGDITYTIGTGTSVMLDAAAGTVTGREFGTQWVYVRRGSLSDSIGVQTIPAGRFVAWLSSDRTIRMLDLNGSNSRVLATGISSEFGAFPRFSANRQRVSYHVASQLPFGKSLTLGLLDTAGAVRAEVNLATVLNGIIVTRHMADGSTLLIATRIATGQVWLWRVSDNNVATPIAEIPGLESVIGAADISSDGTRVAFTTNGRLWVFTVATGALLQTIEFNASFPRWSPQGDRIAYIGSNNNMHGSPVIINGDGSDRRPIGTQLFSAGLAWSPDGTYLLGRSAFHPSGALRIVRISDAKDVVLTYFTSAGTLLDFFQPDWR
ncbi:MAG: TolB family protein [Gemmatimonas sp.]